MSAGRKCTRSSRVHAWKTISESFSSNRPPCSEASLLAAHLKEQVQARRLIGPKAVVDVPRQVAENLGGAESMPGRCARRRLLERLEPGLESRLHGRRSPPGALVVSR